MKVNVSTTKKGFVCPKANISSYGAQLSCTPPPTCFCTKEIRSDEIVLTRDFSPGEFLQISVPVSRQELESFAMKTDLGKKVEVVFAIDTDEKVVEENELNNVASATIWLDLEMKPKLIKGSNPESVLYGFGRFLEWLDLTFTFDGKAKLEKELKIASKRLEEADRMLKANRLDTASSLLEDYTGSMDTALGIYESLPEKEKRTEGEVLAVVASSYINVLKDLYRKEVAEDVERAIETSLKAQQAVETSMAPQLTASGLSPDLEILSVDMPRQILVGEEVEVEFSVLNSGKAQSDFTITLYEDGNPVVDTGNKRLCAGCVGNYSLTWKAKEVSEVSIALNEPRDENQDNNFATLTVEVFSPACSSDRDCDDRDPCTVDVCVDSGTIKARCEHVEVTKCIDNDGCCPSGCNALNDNDCKSSCGNQLCEPGETKDNCCEDCGCPEGYECKNNRCVWQVYCGNGVCEAEENRCNCPEDCGYCSGSCRDEPCWIWECVNGECQCELQSNCCGNGVCEKGEYYIDCEAMVFESSCPDCCTIYPLRIDPYPAGTCSCPAGTQKIIVNPDTGEFVCECPPPPTTQFQPILSRD